MLQSMKQIGDPRKKTDPKKKVRTLSVEELAKSIKYPGSKTPVKKEIDLVILLLCRPLFWLNISYANHHQIFS